MRTLRYRDSGDDVRALQERLRELGHFRGECLGNFLAKTKAAVVYFQQTHLGPDGEFLRADGEVGPATRWALAHPTGRAQRSGLHGNIPAGLTPARQRQLEIALAEHTAGVCEDPPGSNRSARIQTYTHGVVGPWCCYFWSWCDRERGGAFSLGSRIGSCLSAWKRAGALGFARPRDGYTPIPGDAFVLLYRNAAGALKGTGHIGFVLRVEEKDGVATRINTVEGNAGDRVKVGVRKLSDPALVGFINPYPADEQPTGWKRGLVAAASVDRERTR